MVHKIQVGEACGELVKLQTQQITDGLKVELAQDSLIRAQSHQIAAMASETNTWESRFNNQVILTKQERKAKRRWLLISLGVSLLFVLEVVR